MLLGRDLVEVAQRRDRAAGLVHVRPRLGQHRPARRPSRASTTSARGLVRLEAAAGPRGQELVDDDEARRCAGLPRTPGRGCRGRRRASGRRWRGSGRARGIRPRRRVPRPRLDGGPRGLGRPPPRRRLGLRRRGRGRRAASGVERAIDEPSGSVRSLAWTERADLGLSRSTVDASRGCGWPRPRR